jgi:hypothetical protein
MFVVPISVFVIAFSFLLAFNWGARAGAVALLKVLFGWIGHALHVDNWFDINKIQAWEKKHLDSFRKASSPTSPTPSEQASNEKLGSEDSSDDEDDDDEYMSGFLDNRTPRDTSPGSQSRLQSSQLTPRPENTAEAGFAETGITSSRTSIIPRFSRISRSKRPWIADRAV